MKNTSRFLQINSSILLEYIINNNSVNTDSIDKDIFCLNNISLYKLNNGEVLYSENDDKHTNNTIGHLAVPIETNNWFISAKNSPNRFKSYCEEIENIENNNDVCPFDTIRLHILSGYAFKNIYGIMLQVKAKTNIPNKYSHLANWVYRRADGNYTFERPFIINNRVYDKYIDLKIPSIKYLGSISNISDNMNKLIGENGLNIENSINNIEIVYSNISFDNVTTVYNSINNEIGYSFNLDDEITLELPYDSESDRFNILLKESSHGNYLNFCATWDDMPITKAHINAFNTKLKLYSNSNLSEDSYDYMYNASLSDEILNSDNKWMIEHELQTSFYKNGKKILPTQVYSLKQTFNDESENTSVFNYKPILNNNDAAHNIDYIIFEYTARLINNYDGTQIVRKGSLHTFNINRYIDDIKHISYDNIISYNVYNNKTENKAQIIKKDNIVKDKIVKVFYDKSNIIVNSNKNFIQKLSKYGNIVLFQLYQETSTGNKELDLTGMSSYILTFEDDKNNKIEITPTYSSNMNMLFGQLEFNINGNNIDLLRNSKNKTFAIKCKNIDGTSSVVCEIEYTFN